MQEEAERDQHEADVLGVPHARIRPGVRQLTLTLSGVEHRPGLRQEPESTTDEQIAQDVKGAEMRIPAPAEKLLQQVPGVVAK